MPDREILVSFRPSGREVYVLPGTRLIEAAADAGLILDAPCGGQGLCGNCRVVGSAGAAEPTEAERQWLSAEELAAGWRLACQTEIRGPTEVQIPHASAQGDHQILVETDRSAAPPVVDPPVWKRYVELAPPARGDDAPDMTRLRGALGESQLTADLSLLAEMPGRLRESGFRATAVLAPGRLLDVEPGDTTSDAFAVAVDLGTTTLVAELLDLGTGSPWAVEARLNPQTQFGDDVLSRILYTRANADGLRQLRELIIRAVDEMVGALCQRAGVPRRRIYEITLAGNTTMQQLLCGIDVRPLGELPFVPVVCDSLSFPAARLDLGVHPRARAYVMPSIGGFVGGDVAAGMLAAGVADVPGPALLIDVGTNGEIVLQADGRLWAASTAAGPAFEGARISCGMRGAAGAIEKVVVERDKLLLNVIDNARPAGICGSGLIDLGAELLRHGVGAPLGQLLSPDQLPADVPDDLVRRVEPRGPQPSFLLVPEAESADGRPIAVTQRDIRELQLAAGAIRAGIVLLLRRAGLKPGNLHQVFVGGGFGNFIRRSNAQRIGLLPHDIDRSKIRFMGNTSLAGARRAALSLRDRSLVEQLAQRTQHVDLSTDPDFQTAFADSMIFPNP